MLSTLRRTFSTLTTDLCVIGGGPGGYTASIRAAQRGIKTICVENNKLGGTCLNVGCIPSKILLNSAHLIEESREKFDKYGVNAGRVSFDINKLMKTKDGIIRGLNQGIHALYKKNKVNFVQGKASFVDQNTVCIDGNKDNLIKSKNFIIATGSTIAPLPGNIIPIDEKRILSSTGALSLKEVPKVLNVIGGGVIGLELGSAYKNYGSKVNIIEFMDSVLPNFDKEVSAAVARILRKKGINLYLGTKVVGGGYINDGSQVEIKTESRAKPVKKDKLTSDYLLISTGRLSNTKGLNLQEIGIQMAKRGGKILVNKNYQTNISNIYAIGDVIPGLMLAHKAEEDAVFVADYLAGIHQPNEENGLIPSVVYTTPEIAFVGMTEEEIKKKKISYKKAKIPFLANSRARAVKSTEGFVKILCEKATGKILGAHIIGPNAGEMIHECAVAMKFGATDKDITDVCHAHPCFSEAIKETALLSSFKSINF
ncbi:MAG: dihydrolipoyl dehydrogenase [archaeon]|nr:dihydrolipoyl dehydrogenase [archaeon]